MIGELESKVRALEIARSQGALTVQQLERTTNDLMSAKERCLILESKLAASDKERKEIQENLNELKKGWRRRGTTGPKLRRFKSAPSRRRLRSSRQASKPQNSTSKTSEKKRTTRCNNLHTLGTKTGT